MRRIRIIVEYDGTAYSGWQRQLNANSVQQTLEEALRKLTGESELTIVGASRTDAGVHALGQCAHFDTNSRIPAEKFSFALPAFLPDDIRVRDSMRAPDDFHARFWAVGKEYVYSIHNARHASALYRNLRAHVALPMDIALMRAEAMHMLGTHDFAPFAASGSEIKDTVRTIRSCDVRKDGECVSIRVTGNGFLYNMVRILAGTLIGVGTGKLAPGAIPRALKSQSRLDLGVTAPAHGLTLVRVEYDERAHYIEDIDFSSQNR